MEFLNGPVPSALWAEIRGRLAEWNIDLVPDAPLQARGRGAVRVAVRGHEHLYDGIVVPASRVAGLASFPELGAQAARALVITDRLPARSAHTLRSAGIDYVDASGGASLAFDDVVVALSGRGATQIRLPLGPVGPSINLFSASRAQVLAVLLSWPSLLDEPVRVVARVAGTSVGLVHDVLSTLEGLGHLYRSPGRRSPEIEDVRGLAQSWTAAYPGGLRRKLDLGTFRSDPTSWGDEIADALLGGEWAVREEIAASRVVVYAYRIDASLIAGLRLRAGSGSGDENTAVLRRFWQPATLSRRHHIPWLLTYAELFTSPDARVRSTAHGFLDRHAG